MNEPLPPRPFGGFVSTWAILFTLLVTMIWTLWAWGLRGASDGPMPPIRDVGAVELPLVPARDANTSSLPPDKLRPQSIFAVHRVEVELSVRGEPRFPTV